MSLTFDRFGHEENESEMTEEETIQFNEDRPFNEIIFLWLTDKDPEVTSAIRELLTERLIAGPDQAAESLKGWVSRALVPATGSEGPMSLKNPPLHGIARDIVDIALDLVDWLVMVELLNRHFAKSDEAGSAG